MRLRFEPLGNHNRAAFLCGHDDIDRFLKTIASQRQLRQLATTMVAVDADGDSNRIIGFYTVIPHEFRGNELPDPFRKGTRVGALSAVPGAFLAQLGVDTDFQGQGLGKALVRHAFHRIARLANEYGCVAVVTDPIDVRARDFYAGFDFQALPLNIVENPSSQPLDPTFSERLPRMIVTVKTILAGLWALQEVSK